MSSPRVQSLARGLGNAFLTADEWAVQPMVDSAQVVVGGRQRWLWKLARQVLAAYPRPLPDRPRELAAFIGASSILERAVVRSLKTGRPLRAEHIPPAPVQMHPRRPWPVPVLHDLDDLARLLDLDPARLDWFADVRGLQRRATSRRLHHYRYTWLTSASGRPRLLEAPLPRLRSLQRTLLEQVLAPIPVHAEAHGFVPGRSAVTGARAHAGAEVVINLDLASFFTTVSAGRVYGIFRTAGYSEPVAHVLTGLCTHRTPVNIAAAAGSAQARSLLRTAHLPQGAPSSPVLANLSALALDRRLSGLANATGLTYTRYADDLTFSGAAVSARRLVDAVEGIVRSEGFRLQPAKTRIRRASQRQEVTGIVVNEKPSVDRKTLKRFRALLFQIAKDGTQGKRWGAGELMASLEGYANFVALIAPEKGIPLQKQVTDLKRQYGYVTQPGRITALNKKLFRARAARGEAPREKWWQAQGPAAPVAEQTEQQKQALRQPALQQAQPEPEAPPRQETPEPRKARIFTARQWWALIVLFLIITLIRMIF